MKAAALTLMNALFLTTPLQEQVPKTITLDVKPISHAQSDHALLQNTIVTNMLNYMNVRYSGQFYFGA
jgi:hypothetical protein